MSLTRNAPLFLWLLGLSVCLAFLSFCDDKIGLSPGIRLGVHGIATGFVVWGAGLQIQSVRLPMLAEVGLGSLAAPFTFFFIMWITNLYNFMDGMDGFAGGMTVIGFGFLAYFGWRGGHQIILVTSMFVASSAAGFLFHNFPPAKIFLGDIGSISFGFLAASILVLGIRDELFDIWVALLIFSPFIVDATVTLLTRLARREKVWRAHRGHYYQRLVIAGWSHRKTVLIEYALMLAAGFSALLYWNIMPPGKLAVLLTSSLVYLTLAVLVGRVERHSRQSNERSRIAINNP